MTKELDRIDELLDELKEVVDELNEKQKFLEEAETKGDEEEAEKIGDTLIELEDLMENLKRKISRELAEI
jgi:5-bromo-4-chloroindolyl phosphate hydrolysis protein